ncbi:GNAT family N-acetyltransferase [Corallococcus aberystwythensis]|uniref:histidine kinase n=1 Tax=Corallococcus aberystwythensis TaxID=2316722 RepID=A0A3A8PQC4_9BACT|nr:GNAT family N-acetyltransferase [Corallococcus aberystwythensis]RKH58238.1 GNAT family N-acetyltransferase [Corallococcus aberystwythensis]
MPSPYVIRAVQSRAELEQVLALQRRNLKQTLSEDERRTQGFVTVAHDLATLERMHAVAPSIIALHGSELVAYALVMPRECRELVPVLEPMFALIEQLEDRGRPLRDQRFYVMGQICIDKAHRGQGLFDALYQQHREQLRGRFDCVVTEVSVHNRRSMHAHERVGFRTLHTYEDATDTWAVVCWDWSTPERQHAPRRQEEQERSEKVLAAAGIGRWSRDLTRDTIVCDAISRVHCALPADGAVTPAHLWERIHLEDRERVWDAALRALKQRAPFTLRFRIDPGEGAPIKWVHLTGSIFHDAEGRVRHFEGISQDITAERQLEESLRQTLIEKNDSLQNLEIINSTGQALGAELQLEKLVQGVTDAATQLTRAAFGAFFYNVLDERGQAYMLYTLSGVPRESFSKFPMPRATRVFEPTFKGEGIIRSDDITKDPRYGHNAPRRGMPEGHLPVRSYLAVPVTSRSGEVIGGLFFGHPTPGVFTAREERLVAGLAAQVAVAMDNARLFQRVQEAVTSRDTFLSIASHELRTPITSMKLLSQHMRKRIEAQDPAAFTPERVTRMVEQTERSIDRLGRLVDDMLDISRIAAGRLQLHLERVDLGDVAREVVERFEQQLTEAGHTLTLRLVPGLVGRWDRVRLEQVLANLLTNALKYAPGTPLTVSLHARDDHAVLEVEDRGPGIAPEHQHRIFERFERLVTASEVSGLGLGLHIVRHIVEAHGGRIHVRSAVGDGARFFVELPLSGPPDVTP